TCSCQRPSDARTNRIAVASFVRLAGGVVNHAFLASICVPVATSTTHTAFAVTAVGAGTRPKRRSIPCENPRSHGSTTRTSFLRTDRGSERGPLTETAFDCYAPRR